ncbi:hypothetical protein D3C77_629950 [compost metagenome]
MVYHIACCHFRCSDPACAAGAGKRYIAADIGAGQSGQRSRVGAAGIPPSVGTLFIGIYEAVSFLSFHGERDYSFKDSYI